MDPLEMGASGCELDSGEDVETGNLSDVVVAIVAAEARMQGIEP